MNPTKSKAIFILRYGLFGILSLLFLPTFHAHSKHNTVSFYATRNAPINMRSGPGKKYPIKWVLQAQGTPLAFLAKFHNWYKVKDSIGDIGWIQRSLLVPNKNVIVIAKQAVLYADQDKQSQQLATLKKNVIMRVLKDRKEWLEVSVLGTKPLLKGYVLREDIWGVVPLHAKKTVSVTKKG